MRAYEFNRASHRYVVARSAAGTTADLLGAPVAYWDRHTLMGLYLSVVAPGQLDKSFELTNELLDQVSEAAEMP